ncbi:MAG: ABC transporter permease [Alphaproteobacteria bacterium]
MSLSVPPKARPYVQVAPLAVTLVLFVLIPLAMIVVVSFFQYDMITGIVPAFSFENFAELFTNMNTLRLYLSTLKFTAITWAITLVIGFTIAYFLVFHVRNILVAIGLFLLCTVPFWTSNIIRMISWIPLLGKYGLFNQALMGLGIVDEPVEWFLFSDFAVIVCYVHLFTLFMIVPIFNSMARIDRTLIEAARDAGAGPIRIMREIIIPLSKSGIALGSIFVITLVMGDFFVIKIMSGGRAASIVSAMFDDIGILFYPKAASHAVVLLIVVTLIVTAILRVVDVRKELTR